ncbi:glycosyltransferase family 2 protein [Candidatus Poribacteria bacterium]|nr:glycosyltransferase family 2 protein [Candidatus Poribacteria bacterium]
MSNPLDLSIVLPILNEEKNLEELHSRLATTLDKLSLNYEIIAVDDGSTDNSFQILKQISERDSRLKVIRFRRNFGQTAALSAGFHYSKAPVIITLDADLQNDPDDIPRLLDKLNEGYDVVSGWRADRKDKFITRRIPSILANKLIVKLTDVNIHDFGCTLKAYRKEVTDNINLYGEMHRFIPALAKWVGAEITEIKVKHHPRKHGKSKYGISRTTRVILDLITVKFLLSFSTKPIQIFGLIGLGSGFLGFLICLYLSIGKIFFPSEATSLTRRMPMLMLGILLILVGVQFITMGLLGEIMVRTYHESQKKPIYVIKEIVNKEQ